MILVPQLCELLLIFLESYNKPPVRCKTQGMGFTPPPDTDSPGARRGFPAFGPSLAWNSGVMPGLEMSKIVSWLMVSSIVSFYPFFNVALYWRIPGSTEIKTNRG